MFEQQEFVVVEVVKCDFADRNVRGVRRPSRRTAAAITWSASDANMTSAGSASLHGNLTDRHGQSSDHQKFGLLQTERSKNLTSIDTDINCMQSANQIKTE